MPKGENFGLQGCAQPEQPGHGVPDQLEQIAHRCDYRPIRMRSTAVFGLQGTGAQTTSEKRMPSASDALRLVDADIEEHRGHASVDELIVAGRAGRRWPELVAERRHWALCGRSGRSRPPM
jgi:hypothetical protein